MVNQVGAFWRGIPPELLFWAKSKLGSDAVAIETGTYLGDGVELLANNFLRVISIERDHDLATRAASKFSGDKSITILEGSSRNLLGKTLPDANIPTLFWLDAHYSGGITAGQDDPCPLMGELEVILQNRKSDNTIILVDDIRGAVGTNGWPTISEICEISTPANYQIVIIDDVLIATHLDNFDHLSRIAGESRSFMLAHNSANWNLMISAAKILSPLLRIIEAIQRRLKNLLT